MRYFHIRTEIEEIQNGWVFSVWNESEKRYIRTFTDAFEKVGEIYNQYALGQLAKEERNNE